jgi:hypothetical protein
MSSEISGVGPTGMPIGQQEFAAVPNLFERLYISSLSQSDKEAIATSLGASVPEIERMIQMGQSKAIDALLDAWIKNLEEQADRIHLELTSPRFRMWLDAQSAEYRAQVERDSPRAILLGIYQTPEYNMWIQSLPAADRVEELTFSRSESLRAQTIDGVGSYLKSNPDDAAFMTAGLVIAAGAVVETMMINVDGLVGGNPISDSAIALSKLAPNDLSNSLSLAINFYAMTMAYHVIGEVLSKNPNQPTQNQKYAEVFAEQILGKVKGNQVDGFMKALVVNMFYEGQPVSEERALQLATLAKAGMVMVALAVLYNASVGWLNPTEFQALLQGQMKPRSELEGELVKMAQTLRGQLPESMRETFDGAFYSFIAKRPSAEVLMNPLKAANGIFAHVDIPEISG